MCSWLAFWRRQPSRALADDDEGFVRLFNGRNLNGWDVDARDKSTWLVEDGLIVRREGGHWPPVHMRTTSAYADFELRLEYKLHGASLRLSRLLEPRGKSFSSEELLGQGVDH